jgi:starch-binding outer membrane protein, SusD/RagB family
MQKTVYMKRVNNIIFGLLCVAGLTSCKKWLDVPPADKFTEDQVFGSAAGVEQALNGVYLDMSKSKLYGGNLTMTALEIFAQRYNLGDSRRSDYPYSQFAFGDEPVKSTLDNIWTSAYIDIVNLNKFLSSLDASKGVLTSSDDSLYRGEAIALRAMLHFDLLRMFGPMYNNVDSIKPAISYYRQVVKTITPLPQANQVMDSITADLATAERLLSNDPVMTRGVVSVPESDGQDFKRLRNYRLNYFAVKALQARVNLYRGNKPEALAAAATVIQNADTKFPWIVPAKIISEKANPDRVFSTEVLFGLQSLDMYDNFRGLFSADLADGVILAPIDTRLKTFYENNESDYRYIYSWLIAGNKSYRTFYKYAPPAEFNKAPQAYMVPLIRKSEVYYIAAEAEANSATARGYLNTVRFNRGLADLASNANINTELQKEYQKEFYGEGQLFYYYKRRGVTSIPNGNAATGNVSMNATKYVFPLPLSETQYR